MNKLARDIKLRAYGQTANCGSVLSLGLLKLVQVLLGLEEQEFYDKYPVSWWIVVSVGFIFIASLIYTIKRTLDVHPNIQLRSKPDDVLKGVLADPGYQLWHQEAHRLLNKRRKRT